jgi:biotin carboxyl carrier protein
MPSQIIKVLVKEGQEVKSGQGLMIISSMKMENTIEAEKDGVVEEIFAKEGQNVEAGFLLLKLK